ncbi:aryl-alcohol dehydrogenase-like predicted oxidoreductase [Arcanobacterium wilhelmae]|uniref:Aryl-alcohol dehydrogenase-like predicted oxidoreductase n=1 Tax=Arcanobacterium wilhelmae TaxID=1803177 RepID=A0ABT9N984_9ACTO|nr:aldo/keto reductase [Arcanobacterium wilhelmae]MDP9799966.1 aryl-alcohol dehydrogenase-like predicted oxidoreductase [Arcanobacterium wilhelmae]WFN91099.1 aldo/keto reductase [Arcanobacterium wilhelmae]
MKTKRIGSSGLECGQIGLGTLTWGRDTESEEAQSQVFSLLEAGGNAIDLSPAYSDGAGLDVMSDILASGAPRAELALILHAGITPEGINTGRRSLIQSVRSSLERMGTDYADVVMIAGPDPLTPIEETLHAAADLVRGGFTHYIGLANFPTWLAATAAQYVADHQLFPLVALGARYSLLDRSAEATAFLAHAGMGMFAYAPLAGGVLTGKYRHTIPPTSRAATDHLAWTVEQHLTDSQRSLTEAVTRAADGLARTPADVALAWSLMRPEIGAVFIGARTASQFDQALALDLSPLPAPVAQALGEVSR